MENSGRDEELDHVYTEKKDHQLKVVLLGDSETGKTSLATRISQNRFTGKYQETLGVDFYLSRLDLPGDVHVTLQVWDVGGQTNSAMLKNYLYGAQAVLFVYDITNHESFDNLDKWLKEATKILNKTVDVLPKFSLVANKTDLEHMRTVRRDHHAALATTHNMQSHYVSAKTDDMVYQCFMKVAASILQVRLTVADLAINEKVIKADITPHVNPQSLPSQSDAHSKAGTTTSFCILQ